MATRKIADEGHVPVQHVAVRATPVHVLAAADLGLSTTRTPFPEPYAYSTLTDNIFFLILLSYILQSLHNHASPGTSHDWFHYILTMKGLILFGACAVVAVAVVVIEEWPTIKETYFEVRDRRRRRRISVAPHEYHRHSSPDAEQVMVASGVHEPPQEMAMRARALVLSCNDIL